MSESTKSTKVVKLIKLKRKISALLLFSLFLSVGSLFVSCKNENAEGDVENMETESTLEEETETESETEAETETETEPETTTEDPLKPYTHENIIKYDITYKVTSDTNADPAEMKFDIYYPTNRKYEKSPVLFAFFGGGWISGDKTNLPITLNPLFTQLREEGYAIVAPQYRYVSEVIYFPSNIEDCIDAMLFFKNHGDEYDIDINRAGVIGYSAGAHLALMTSYAMKEFSTGGDIIDLNYCISISGPTKMYDTEGEEYPRATMILLEYLFNGTLEEKQEDYKKGSPYFYLTPESKTSLMLVHGDMDDVVPHQQSVLMYEKAQELGIKSELLTLPGVRHTVNLVQSINISPDDAEVTKIIKDFILNNTTD